MIPPDEKSFSANAGAGEPDTRQRILEAAAEVFTKSGYSRATTKNIAKAAGVSEVTLFRHFSTKEELLQAAMETYGSPYLIRMIEGKLTGVYADDMRTIGRFFMRAMTERAGAVCFFIGEARHFPMLRPLFSKMPKQMWRMLAEYLQAKMDRGEVRRLHPEAAAQAFFAMFFAYTVGREALGLEPEPEVSLEEKTDQIVDIFVRGTIAHKDG